MVDVKIRAGTHFEFDVPVHGEPPPSKEWNVKDNIILPNERTKITNEDYNTRLRITDARRSDSGTYTLIAKNINGKDVAEVHVTVLGKLRIYFQRSKYVTLSISVFYLSLTSQGS